MQDSITLSVSHNLILSTRFRQLLAMIGCLSLIVAFEIGSTQVGSSPLVPLSMALAYASALTACAFRFLVTPKMLLVLRIKYVDELMTLLSVLMGLLLIHNVFERLLSQHLFYITAGFLCFFLPLLWFRGALALGLAGWAVLILLIEDQLTAWQPFALGIFLSLGPKIYSEVHRLRLQEALGRATYELKSRQKTAKALRASQDLYSIIARASNDGFWDWNLKTDELFISSHFGEMLGLDKRRLVRNPSDWFRCVLPEDLPDLKREIDRCKIGKGSSFEVEYRILGNGKKHRWLSWRGHCLRDKEGTPYRIAGSLTEITDQKAREHSLFHDAYHDGLTGLRNRVNFVGQIATNLQRSKQEPDYRFAVMFLDLDNFKSVNDTHGHLVGDELIVATAGRLKHAVRNVDIVARFGGDEFAIIVEQVSSRADMLTAITRVKESFEAPFVLSGRDFLVTPSIGVVWADQEYEDADDVLKDSDTAMYSAKRGGKNRYAIFEKHKHLHTLTDQKSEKNSSVDERRQNQRYSVKIHCGVMQGGKSRQAEIINLSLDGALIRMKKAPPRDALIQLSFSDDKSGSIHVTARVAHVSSSVTGNYECFGVSFTACMGRSLERLTKMLWRLLSQEEATESDQKNLKSA